MNKRVMKQEIKMLCKYKSMQVAYFSMLGMFAFMMIVVTFARCLQTPMVLLVFGIVFPMIEEGFYFQHTEEPTVFFQEVYKKYGFNLKKYKSYTFAFYLEMILLIAWQFANNKSLITPYYIRIAPVIIMILAILIRSFSYIYYRRVISYNLRYNQWQITGNCKKYTN